MDDFDCPSAYDRKPIGSKGEDILFFSGLICAMLVCVAIASDVLATFVKWAR